MRGTGVEAMSQATSSIPEVFQGTFGCGHDGEVSLAKVPSYKRFARIRFLKQKGKCKKCFTKSREKELRAEDAKVGEWAREQGLPELHGTDKQVRYANTIRQQMLLDAYEALVQSGRISESEWGSRVQAAIELVTSAHWWVEIKDIEASQLPVVVSSATEVKAAAWEQAVAASEVQGSAGQVAWATRARYELVESARDHFQGRGMDARTFREQIEDPAAKINAAHWWLDVRDAPAEALPALLDDAGDDAYLENDL